MKVAALLSAVVLVAAISGSAWSQRARPSLDQSFRTTPDFRDSMRPDMLDRPNLEVPRDIAPLPELSESPSILPPPPRTPSENRINSETIAVTNLGNKILNFSYWNGETAWQQLQVSPAQRITVACARCGRTIHIAYHDGRENRTVTVPMGTENALYWADAQGRWDFAALKAATPGAASR